jgi:hypothetical protein
MRWLGAIERQRPPSFGRVGNLPHALTVDLSLNAGITRNPIREAWFEISISVDWN